MTGYYSNLYLKCTEITANLELDEERLDDRLVYDDEDEYDEDLLE